MTPNEVVAVATVAGVILAALFGISGFVVGLVGLHHANKAKEAAASANLIAKGANSIAKGANALSSVANTIAREANDIARSGEVRATEQHDARARTPPSYRLSGPHPATGLPTTRRRDPRSTNRQ